MRTTLCSGTYTAFSYCATITSTLHPSPFLSSPTPPSISTSVGYSFMLSSPPSSLAGIGATLRTVPENTRPGSASHLTRAAMPVVTLRMLDSGMLKLAMNESAEGSLAIVPPGHISLPGSTSPRQRCRW